MSERRVFEDLCMEPGKGGFSYDSALLVDVDHAFDFDEAVIRLTTKCNSIITQLHTLGHHVTEFSIASAKVGPSHSKSLESCKKSALGLVDKTCSHIPSITSTPEGRNLKAMEEQWSGLKRKNYSGMVAIARLSRSSIPRNGSGARYSVQMLTEALLSHIQAYFMFQSYNPKFQPRRTAGTGHKDEGAQAEYLVYLVYRIQPVNVLSPSKRSRRLSELERLEVTWPLEPSTTKRKRQLSSGSSVSSSSMSSSPSSDVAYLSPPAACSSLLISPGSTTTPASSLFQNQESKENEHYNPDWPNWSAPQDMHSPKSREDRVQTPVLNPPVIERNLKGCLRSSSSSARRLKYK